MKKPALNTNLLILLACLFVVMMGYGVLLPVLPFFLERIVGVAPDNIAFHFGILTAIYPITLVFTAPLWGKVTDRIGPKWPIVIGLGGFILMQVMIAFSTSLTMLYVARVVGSPLSSFLVPVINAFISGITNKDNRTQAMAWAGTAVSAGVVTGPGISGLLIGNNWHLRWEPSVHLVIDRFSVPFLVLALVGVVTLLVALPFLKNSKPPKPVTLPHRRSGHLFPTGKWKLFGRLLMLSLVLQVGITSFESIFPLFIKDSGQFSVVFIGMGLLICGLVMAVLQPVVAKWGSLLVRNPEKQIAWGFLIAGLTLPVYVLSQTPWVILVAIGIFGLGSSLVVPNLLALVSLREPESSGWALGMQSSFSGIGQMAGPLAGTALYALSPGSPFDLTGALLVGTSLVGFRNLNVSKDKQLKVNNSREKSIAINFNKKGET
ncbi:MAG: MFS transporter [Owenweeksia sp.]|nr:MFS transporter [Owenweeksia sp.]